MYVRTYSVHPSFIYLMVRIPTIMPKTRSATSAQRAKEVETRTSIKQSPSGSCSTRTSKQAGTPGTPGGVSFTHLTNRVELDLVQVFRSLCTNAISKDREQCAKYAQEIKKYMRNQFDFFGIKTPLRRKLQKEVIDRNRDTLINRKTLLLFVSQLWLQNERDFQAFGTDLCHQFRTEMLGSTDDHFRKAVAIVEACITTKSWWDTVDYLAYQVIGYYVKERPALGAPLMNQWINSDNMWLRRVAILHQLNWKVDTDKDRLFSMCLSRADEKEFFIRKAIGWALRTYSRTNGLAVRQFVETNKDSLSGLSIREALKYC